MPIRRLCCAPFDTLVSAKEANRSNHGSIARRALNFLDMSAWELAWSALFAPHVLHSFSHCPCCEAATRAYEQNNRALSFERMTRLVQLDGTGQFAQRQT